MVFLSCLMIASTLICLDLSCLCSGNIILSLFSLSGICGLFTCELYELLFIFPLCNSVAELYKYKNHNVLICFASLLAWAFCSIVVFFIFLTCL